MASLLRSSRLDHGCRIACSRSPWINVPHAIPASARWLGESCATTLVASSAAVASAASTIFDVCLASAVTETTDQLASVAVDSAVTRAASAAPCAFDEHAAG